MKNDNWTLEDLVDAWEKILMASEQFGIPVSKLQGHLDDTICLRMGGRKGVLTLDEEEELVTYVINMALIGHPLVIIEVGSGGEDTRKGDPFQVWHSWQILVAMVLQRETRSNFKNIWNADESGAQVGRSGCVV